MLSHHHHHHHQHQHQDLQLQQHQDHQFSHHLPHLYQPYHLLSPFHVKSVSSHSSSSFPLQILRVLLAHPEAPRPVSHIEDIDSFRSNSPVGLTDPSQRTSPYRPVASPSGCYQPTYSHIARSHQPRQCENLASPPVSDALLIFVQIFWIWTSHLQKKLARWQYEWDSMSEQLGIAVEVLYLLKTTETPCREWFQA